MLHASPLNPLTHVHNRIAVATDRHRHFITESKMRSCSTHHHSTHARNRMAVATDTETLSHAESKLRSHSMHQHPPTHPPTHPHPQQNGCSRPAMWQRLSSAWSPSRRPCDSWHPPLTTKTSVNHKTVLWEDSVSVNSQ